VNRDYSIGLEPGFSPSVINDLKTRGHKIISNEHASHSGEFGGAQLIFCLEDGYCAASDPRKDGQALGF
jgi:gamma-glutamyltranspeptidase/glutathione hydrolase